MAAKPEDLNLDYNCSIKINGSEYPANTDETILDVSKRNGIETVSYTHLTLPTKRSV